MRMFFVFYILQSPGVGRSYGKKGQKKAHLKPLKPRQWCLFFANLNFKYGHPCRGLGC